LPAGIVVTGVFPFRIAGSKDTGMPISVQNRSASDLDKRVNKEARSLLDIMINKYEREGGYLPEFIREKGGTPAKRRSWERERGILLKKE